ncbi:MAG: ABC transporter ATP-binding protein [Pirellulaceae bacterium]|nr:ABC transporter ATP-binding protein [Pirellulaceae bacterium]
MPILETRDVSKSYGTGDAAVAALRGVSTIINAGDFVAIMGPSGSGKSTLLTILGGVETPTSGQVLLEDADIAQLSDDERTKLRRRRIGFIFQSFNLLPNLSAVENVALPMELDGKSRAESQKLAIAALDLVEMSHRQKHLPAQLSGGEQQRVAIARALAINPAILLADEPTGNLDSRQSDRVTKLLTDLVTQRNQTIVMVTHDPSVATIAGRILKIRDGAIEYDGPTEEAQLSPDHAIARPTIRVHGAARQ